MCVRACVYNTWVGVHLRASFVMCPLCEYMCVCARARLGVG